MARRDKAERPIFYRAIWTPTGGKAVLQKEIRTTQHAARADLEGLMSELGGGDGGILGAQAPNLGQARHILVEGGPFAQRSGWGGK